VKRKKNTGSNQDSTLKEAGSMLFFTSIVLLMFLGYPSILNTYNGFQNEFAESFDVPYPEKHQIIQLDPSGHPLSWVTYYTIQDQQPPQIFPNFIPVADAETVNRRIIIQADRIMGASGTGGDFFNVNATLQPCNPEPIANPQGAFGGLGGYPVNKRLVTQNQNTCTGYYHQNTIGQPSRVPPDVAFYMDSFGWQARLISGQGGNGCNTDSIIGIPTTATGGTMTFQQAVNVSSPKFSTSTAGCTIFLPPSFPTAIGAPMGTTGLNFYRDLFLTGIYPNGDLLSDGLGMLHSVPSLPWATRGVFSTVTMNQNWFFADLSVIPTNATNGLWELKEHSKYPTGIMDDCQFERLDDSFSIKTGTTDAEQGQCVIFKTFSSNEVYFEDDFSTGFARTVFTSDEWDTSLPSKFDINNVTGKLDIFVSDTNDNADGIRFNNGELIDSQAFVVQIPWTSATYFSGSSDQDLFYSMSSSTSFNRFSHADAMSFSWTVESTGEKRFVTYLNDGSLSQDIDDGGVFLNATDQGSAMDSGCMEMVKDGRYKTWNFYTDTACTVLKDTLTRTTGEGLSPIDLRYPVFHYSDQANTGTGNITIAIDEIRIYNGQTEVPTSPFLPDIKVEGFVSGSGSNEMRAIVEVYDGKQDSTVLYTLPQGSESSVFEGDFRENQLVFDLGDGIQDFSNHRMGVTEIDVSSGVPVPFTLPISPHYPSGKGEFNEKPIGTFTVSVGLEDDSIDGVLSMNITKITVGEHEYDFDKPVVTFWEQTIPASASSGCGGCTGTDTQPAKPELDQGFVDANYTSVAPFIHGLDLPAPPTAINNIQALAVSSINVTWTHDGANTTGYRIYRTSTEAVDEIKWFDTTTGSNTKDALSFNNDSSVEAGFTQGADTPNPVGKIISRIDGFLSNDFGGSNFGVGGKVQGVLFSSVVSGQPDNSRHVNSTTFIDLESQINNTSTWIAVSVDFTGDDLYNVTASDRFGLGIGWEMIESTGNLDVREADGASTGCCQLYRWLSDITGFSPSGGRDAQLDIYEVNQTKLFSPAIPFVNDTGSLDLNFLDITSIAGNTYFYRIIPLNGDVEGIVVAIVNATEPAPPNRVTGVIGNFVADNTEVRLTWTEPPSDATILNYTIFRDDVFKGNSTTESFTDNIDTIFPRVDTTLASFDYKISAISVAGAGTNSTIETVDPLPDRVTSLTVVDITPTQNDLDWVAPSGNGFAITGYKIERADTFTNIESFENYTLGQPLNTELDSLGWVSFNKGITLPLSVVKNQFRIFDQNATDGTQALDFFANNQRLPSVFSSTSGSGAGLFEIDPENIAFSLNITGRHAFGGGNEDERGGTNWVLVEWNLNNGTTLTKVMQTATAEEGLGICPVDDPFVTYFTSGYSECVTPATTPPAIRWSNGTLDGQGSSSADDFVTNAGQGTLVLGETDIISLNVKTEFNSLFPLDDYDTDVESWDLIMGVSGTSSQTSQSKRNHIGGQIVVDEIVFTGGNPISIWETLVADTGNTNVIFNDTSPTGLKVIYRISALTSIGSGVASEEKGFIIQTFPSPIVDLLADPVGAQCNLSWTLPFNGGATINGHRIQVRVDGGSFIDLVANTTNSNVAFNHTSLNIGSTYEYDIRALNINGEALASNIPMCVPELSTPPDPPTALGLQNVGADVQLDWTAPAQSVTGYKIERKIASGAFEVLIADTASTSTTFTDTTIPALGTEVTYRVRSLNTFGESAPSGEATITTLNPPNMPTLTAVQVGSLITLDWTEPTSAGTINGYKIERQVNFGGFTDLVSNTTNTLLTIDDSAVSKPNTYSYRVSAHDDIPSTGSTSNQVDVVFGSHQEVKIREQDGSGYKGFGDVIISNSTFSQTKAIDSLSNVVFSNLASGLYNYTFKDMDDFVLNKTINDSFQSALTIESFTVNALVFDVDCPATIGSDLRIKMNYTNIQDIVSYPSSPVCDSSDKVSWSTTWDSGTGTATSQMVADFISARFQTNADNFLVSLIPTSTIYSDPLNRIISSSFNITTTSPTTINFDLFLGEAPPSSSSPSSSPSSSGGQTSIPQLKIVFEDRLTGLTLLSLSHMFIQPNDVIDGTITVGWNGESGMRVNRIDVGEFTDLIRFTTTTPFMLASITEGAGETARTEANVDYKIFIPPAFCDADAGILLNCLERELIIIPVTFTFEFQGQEFIGQTEVILDAREIPIDIVQLQVIALGIVVIFSAFVGNAFRSRFKKKNVRKRKIKKKFDSS
jgi:hypothetical protein